MPPALLQGLEPDDFSIDLARLRIKEAKLTLATPCVIARSKIKVKSFSQSFAGRLFCLSGYLVKRLLQVIGQYYIHTHGHEKTPRYYILIYI
ncbi:hypothetical protein XB05_13690 [Xanthomonas arboricola]|nr:hypothetical protein XB05_13690 [Xanthomonas arboricola]